MTTTAQPIFVGRKNSGEGWRFYPAAESLLTDQPRFSRVCHVTHDGQKWSEDNGGYSTEAAKIAKVQLTDLAARMLRDHRRVCHSNSSYEAARSEGTIATVFGREHDYTVIVVDWSRWEGDKDTVRETRRFTSLAEARDFAETSCEMSPTFGDVEWY